MTDVVHPPPLILLPILAGIGNAVMAVPLVRELGRAGEVTIAARTSAMADVFRGLPEVAAVEVIGSGHWQAWRRHRELVRQLRPDVYVVPFPSNRWQYAVLAATSGARRIVMHDYPTGAMRALRFWPRLRGATLVPAERGVHDVTQNLKLLDVIEQGDGGCAWRHAGGAGDAGDAGVRMRSTAAPSPSPSHPCTVSPPHSPPLAPIFNVTDAHRAAAREQLHRALAATSSPRTTAKRSPAHFIALQPGCGDTPVGRAKRWPAESFAALADILAERGHDILVFEGPDERGVGRDVSGLARSRPAVIELSGPLGHAAALLEMAALYIGNDSALAHIAAAVGTPPVTLFAAADPARVAPFGYEHLVVTPRPHDGVAWRPRLLYPMDHPGPRLASARGIDWAAQIHLDDVLSAVERALAGTRSGSAPEGAKTQSVVPTLV